MLETNIPISTQKEQWCDLYQLRWYRLDLTLRNTFNQYARSHPLIIFDGILMTLVPPELKPPDKPRRFFFRPLAPIGERITRNQDYRLRILLPILSDAQIAAVKAAFAKPIPHFEIVSQPIFVPCSLADLERATPMPANPEEVCLDFYTPLDFQASDSERPWLISAAEFGAILTRKLEKFFGQPLPDATQAWESVQTLPYYWRRSAMSPSSKSSGGRRNIVGNVGPLFLRGPLDRVWPLLLLGTEFSAGTKFAGLGACSLDSTGQAYFTRHLCEPATYLAAYQELAERHDPPEEFHHVLRDPQTAATEIAHEIAAQTWNPSEARGFLVRKESGGEARRMIVQLAPRDFVVHKALHQLLSPLFDHVFEPASVGYRPGCSPSLIANKIRNAYREGRVWALRADVEEFFDQVDWTLMLEKVRQLVPKGDSLLLALIGRALRTPVSINGKPIIRERGLLQGSPLSPLLSNVYLNGFDAEMERADLCHVRFADDLLVLCQSEAEAQQALETVRKLLSPLKLQLNDAKTAVLPCEAGFQFLGQAYGGGLDPARVAEAQARRTLYLRDPRAWAGVDHDSLVVRTGSELQARVPLRRLDGVVLLGAGGISARLVERLNDWALPLTFCTAAGKPWNTLFPRTREHLDTASAHASRHAALNDCQRVAFAGRIVWSKIHNYAAWLAELPGVPARSVAEVLRRSLERLASANTVEQLLGFEGAAARLTFRFVNDRVGPDWHSAERVPGERKDPWNSLLDFGSHLLFGRLLVFHLQRGLNPWLGFLHSPINRYESLVYDLMEPFRCRMDRFLLKLVNRRIIQLPDFEPHPHGGQRLNGEAVARYLEQWERELLTTNSGDPSHLLDLLQAQVLSLKAWIKGAGEPGIYHARMRRILPSDQPQKLPTPLSAETGAVSEKKPPENREVPGNSPAST
jgi:CRISPR-associated protein Cas1